MNNGSVYLTVDVEEWFHSNWFNVPKVIGEYYGGIYPNNDVVNTTEQLMNTFDSFNVKATFFVLGETVERYPEIIEILKSSEHEIACHGWYHKNKYSNIEDFKRDVLKFKNEVYSDVKGFRFPNFEGYSNEKFKFILNEGFKYDSSIVPCINIPGWYGKSNSIMKPYNMNFDESLSLMEFPISVFPYLRLPGAGGWFFRNLGYHWTKNLLKYSLKKTGYGMLYIHPWEISDSNPKNIKDIKFHVFRNSGNKTLNNLTKLIETFSGNKFPTISEGLKLY